MVTLERRRRKGGVLTRSSLPCLRGVASVNLTEGCAHQCVYCYSQGYSNFPGRGRVVLFEDTPELLAEELRRKRRPPRRVYFSPSTDPLQPIAEVLDSAARSMALLLRRGVEVAFLTKGSVPAAIVEELANFPSRVFAQVGITTLVPDKAAALEPGATSPSDRLESIGRLADCGLRVRARLDPLIPDVTDGEEELRDLLASLARCGVRSVAASYLFLRPAFAARVRERVRGFGAPREAEWETRDGGDGLGGCLVLPAAERSARFARLQALAAAVGMSVHICACKNPDLAATSCQIAGPPAVRYNGASLELWSCER